MARVWTLLCMCLALNGCELLARFDRSRIHALPDGSVDAQGDSNPAASDPTVDTANLSKPAAGSGF